jgi:hypothetical protein
MRRKKRRQLQDQQNAGAVPRPAKKPARSVATGRQIRFGRALGLLVCAGGFVAMGFGWAGTARVSCTDCQIPYLLSGGAAGLGLVIFGVTILVLAQLRAEGRRTADRLDRFEERLTEALSRGDDAHPATPAVTVQEPPPNNIGNGGTSAPLPSPTRFSAPARAEPG